MHVCVRKSIVRPLEDSERVPRGSGGLLCFWNNSKEAGLPSCSTFSVFTWNRVTLFTLTQQCDGAIHRITAILKHNKTNHSAPKAESGTRVSSCLMSLIFLPCLVFLVCMLASSERRSRLSLRRAGRMGAPPCWAWPGVPTCVSLPKQSTVESRSLRVLAEWDRDTPVGKVLGLVPRSLSCGLHAAPCWSSQKWVTLVWNSHSQTTGWGYPTGQGVYKVKIIL